MKHHITKRSAVNADRILLGYNLSRIFVFSILLILVEFLNLASDTFWESRAYKTGGILLFIVCLLGIFCTQLWFKPPRFSDRALNLFYTGFWVCIVLAFVPYFSGDATRIGQPFNAVLLCGILLAIPILNLWQAMLVFGTFTLTCVFCAVYYKTSAMYVLQSALICVIGFVVCIIIQRQYQALIDRLNHDVRTDFLTNIANRKGGMEQLQQARNGAAQKNKLLAVYIMDLDFFKQYNDAFGHLAGDTVLMRVSNLLGQKCKTGQDSVFRLGGEEFVMTQQVPSPEYACGFAANLLQDVEELRIKAGIDTASQWVTISCGITIVPPDDISTSNLALIDQADQAMYQAKISGRNCYKLYE